MAKRKNGPWRCDACDVSANCEIGLHAHLNGKKHKAKECAATAAKDETLADGEGHKIAGTADEKLCCRICEVQCNSEAMMENHLKGRKHRGKALTEDDVTGEEKKGRGGFWCGICRLGCNGESTMEKHLNGKKHKAREAKKSRTDAKAARTKGGARAGTDEEGKEEEEMIEGEIDEEETKEAEIKGEVQEKEVEEVESQDEIKEDQDLTGQCISEIDEAEEADLRTGNEEEEEIKAAAAEKEIKKEVYDEVKDEDGAEDPEDHYCISNGKTEDEEKEEMTKEEEIKEGNGKKEDDEGHRNEKYVGLWCEICEVKCNSKLMMAGHRKGKKHKAKEAKLGLLEEGKGDQMRSSSVLEQDTKLREAKEKKNKEFWCLICRVKCDSQATMAKHLQGGEHKAEVGLRWGKQQAKKE